MKHCPLWILRYLMTMKEKHWIIFKNFAALMEQKNYTLFRIKSQGTQKPPNVHSLVTNSLEIYLYNDRDFVHQEAVGEDEGGHRFDYWHGADGYARVVARAGR